MIFFPALIGGAVGLTALLFAGGKKKKAAPVDVEEILPVEDPSAVVVEDVDSGDTLVVPTDIGTDPGPSGAPVGAPPEEMSDDEVSEDPDVAEAVATAPPGSSVLVDDATGDISVVEPPAVEQAPPVEAPPVEAPPEEMSDDEVSEDPDVAEAVATAPPGSSVLVDDATGDIAVVEPGDAKPGAASPLALDLVRSLLAAEHLANWKTHHAADVRLYQEAKGLEPDGRFGPLTALALAQETGVAPIVRYWSEGWRGGPAQQDYVARLRALGLDASREKGQGYGPVQRITTYGVAP